MPRSTPARDWTVLFIGGATVTGKSTLATELGHHFGVPVLEVDLFSKVIDRVLPATHNPGLQLFGHEDIWNLPTEQLAQRLFQMAEFICNALEVVVADRLSTNTPAIIEGAWLLPSFVTNESYASDQRVRPRAQAGPQACRSLFLVEPALKEMEQRLEERYYRGWLASNPGNAATSHLYGLEIARQAAALNLPVLESRPFDTLLDRALRILRSS